MLATKAHGRPADGYGKESPGSLGRGRGSSALCVVGALGCCRRDSNALSAWWFRIQTKAPARALSTRVGSALSRSALYGSLTINERVWVLRKYP